VAPIDLKGTRRAGVLGLAPGWGGVPPTPSSWTRPLSAAGGARHAPAKSNVEASAGDKTPLVITWRGHRVSVPAVPDGGPGRGTDSGLALLLGQDAACSTCSPPHGRGLAGPVADGLRWEHGGPAWRMAGRR